ncbi:uncharacterized protein BCR38DRAFT_414836 [Pseudomassariella vexata]|uniref:Uncharacterized protein n=1 Tax=Pseudomassariella vexata TaxID=1141098 RepID=A0A1Y2D8W0_9PEZI|nr:uncharacterized protein BCR38DRAFT_414836 [Pseudomassariella vexata]ORY55657.1 hypothetical protein BCR38DRAFT_414836 [Pseudomassariella vexata]
MLEPWDEVLIREKESQSCADDVETIKTTCAKEHGKRHVSECSECWSRLVNRMRDRYLNSATQEWFSGRRLFLQELDTLFAQAHEHKIDLKAIDERIFEQKQEWFREKVKNMGLQAATKTPSETRELQQLLNDKGIPVEQLSSNLRGAFRDGLVNNEKASNEFLDRLSNTKTPQERNEACVDIFFQPTHDPDGAAKAQKYIDMVHNGTPVADVISAMLRDRQTSKGNQDQRQALEKKLEELRRAKAAHEADKAKKAKIRQEKADAAAAASEPDFPLPPCAFCSKAVNTAGFVPCYICLVLSEHYRLQDEPIVFCSDDGPHMEAYESHCKTHHCSSDQECRRLQDEDVMMDDGSSIDPVFCQECVDVLKLPSLFCSAQCFDANFDMHCDRIHKELDDNEIGQFGCVSLSDATREWEQKTGAFNV